MTLSELIAAYETDTDSPIHKLRWATKENYRGLLARLVLTYGATDLKDLNGRTLLRWHAGWAAPDEPEGKQKTAMAHGMVGMLRTLFNFGATLIENPECDRLATALHRMRFPMGKPRTERLTYQQATAIRQRANALGLHSIALAQAFQFECMLRQKDCIGEWIPEAERGKSDVIFEGRKWLFGIRWEEIDDDLVLRHVTNKRGKLIEVQLTNAPSVLEELPPFSIMPSYGPVIECEQTGRPWTTVGFRRMWRRIATEVGIPEEVRNMDSRAGAISEATDAGADLEHIRHAATHSNISMTQRYSRNGAEKTAGVMQKRVEHRNGGVQ